MAERLMDYLIALLPRRRPQASAFKNCFLVAHRGMHDHANGVIENTILAFDRALKQGCKGIEFDIRTTADGKLVVNHDPDLWRLWGHNKLIKNLSLQQLRSLEPKIPTLAEMVQKYGGQIHLFIELKAPFDNFSELFAQLQSLTPCRDYHLITLDAKIFAKQKLFPNQCLLLVPIFNVKEYCDLSLQQGYGGLLGNYILVRNKYVRTLNQAQQLVGVGMVDSEYSLYRELGRGIRYIFTNNAKKIDTLLSGVADAPEA